MRNDPFYLFKALTLKASLGVLSVDGNFVKSIAYFKLFVKLNNKVNIWERGRSVGGDCYHTIFMFDIKFYCIPMVGVMAIVPTNMIVYNL